MMTYYDFNVKEESQQIFYRIFKFYTLSGRFGLSYIRLFGDVINESDELPKNIATNQQITFTYKNMPKIMSIKKDSAVPGIFRKAMRIFGPELNNFVKVVHSPAADIKAYDAWNARNHFYSSIEKNDIITISFYFLHHELFISG